MRRDRVGFAVVVGITAAAAGLIGGASRLLAQSTAPPLGPAAELAALRAEIRQLRDQLPGQSHVMLDVGQHFSGLWFAADNRNWDLASFMFNETVSHLKWAVRVRPTRKLTDGTELQLVGILDGLQNGVMDKLKASVVNRNQKEFQQAYRATAEGCNSCHQAAEKPYLKVRVPARMGELPLDLKPTPVL
jgi:hypothetical protein